MVSGYSTRSKWNTKFRVALYLQLCTGISSVVPCHMPLPVLFPVRAAKYIYLYMYIHVPYSVRSERSL